MHWGIEVIALPWKEPLPTLRYEKQAVTAYAAVHQEKCFDDLKPSCIMTNLQEFLSIQVENSMHVFAYF